MGISGDSFMRNIMRWLPIAMVLSAFIVSCAKDTPKVLLFLREGSPDLEYMLNREVGVMKDTLERSGFRVVIATADGSDFSAGSARVNADLKLSEVDVNDYAGFVLPCMAAGTKVDATILPELIALVKKSLSAGKPVAAQTSSVMILSDAGVLKGKKYASMSEILNLEGATYSGTGVVKDGLILTSGFCPYVARALNTTDGTEPLTLALIDAIRGKK